MTGVGAFRANAGLFLSCMPVIPGVNKLYQAELAIFKDYF
jgi:hypothetical protein